MKLWNRAVHSIRNIATLGGMFLALGQGPTPIANAQAATDAVAECAWDQLTAPSTDSPLLAQQSQAASPMFPEKINQKKPEDQDPLQAPPPGMNREIIRPPEVKALGCPRPFKIGRKIYSTDSPQSQDAGGLLRALRDDPEAYALLEHYESNRRRARISAYTGSLGLGLMIFSPMIARWVTQTDTQSVQATLRTVGLAITAGGFIYGFTVLRTNEALIPKAVETYNKNHPNQPIELLFEAGWRF